MGGGPPSPRDGGFALVVTVALLVLLALVAVGLLSLSAIALRSGGHGAARAEAEANARLALLLAIGELQRQLGPDQSVTAPAGILDAEPETVVPDGVGHPHLTGVWSARDEELGERPDYDRRAPFRAWLVSNTDREALGELDFAAGGELRDPVVMAGAPEEPGPEAPAGEVVAGRVTVGHRGACAWWVGDENCKARVNPRDELARSTDPAVAELLAAFATPGASGIQAVEGFDAFPANSAASDKVLTLGELDLVSGAAPGSAVLFHDLSPHAESVLASVTRGGLRKDLNLYLERTDRGVDWQHPWGRAEGQTRPPAGPLGPNGRIALSDPRGYDVLGWKMLHHWYHMHRLLGFGRHGPEVTVLNINAPLDPIRNPGWNSGVTWLAPVINRVQILASYSTRRVGENRYQLFFHAYPVLTLWNPYNVAMRIDQYHCYLHTLPLEHRIYINGREQRLASPVPNVDGRYAWSWPHGDVRMRFGPGGILRDGLVLRPGESRHLFYASAYVASFHNYVLTTERLPWSDDHAGLARDLGVFNAKSSDRIEIETLPATWQTSGASYGMFDTTFDILGVPEETHMGMHDRFNKQIMGGTVAWRHEEGNPSSLAVSRHNFPSRTLGEIADNPTPFLLVEGRLKTLDEWKLPNKTFLHNIPGHPFVAATSTSRHGVDPITPFFAHPYTLEFEQKTTIEGIFQAEAYFGPSNSPAGQLFITEREIPIVPLTSLAQLQNFALYPIEWLNCSGYYLQNHAIGNSFAHPGLAPDEIRKLSFPFHVGGYLAERAGDMAGTLYPYHTFNGAEYKIPSAPALVVDRSYVANHLLFDDYFFSSMAAQDSGFFEAYGEPRSIRQVVAQFYRRERPLPNAAYRPFTGPAGTPGEVVDSLIDSSGRVAEDAWLRAAARLVVEGGFNINSTSVPAWTAVLATAHLKRPVVLEADARSSRPRSREPGRFIVSRFTMPNGGPADRSAATEDLRWRGYRELEPEEIRQLARAIVKQVKLRGPFRSLGEFVNRRLGDADDPTVLHGALQAALEDEEVDINAQYREPSITVDDLKYDGRPVNYAFRRAALGPRYQGTPAYVMQADLLNPLAPVINARSDTFLVRAYGEARSRDGATVLARAWCEAVVQRSPEFLDPADPAHAPLADLKSQANKSFGRRFEIRAFRWLGRDEV